MNTCTSRPASGERTGPPPTPNQSWITVKNSFPDAFPPNNPVQKKNPKTNQLRKDLCDWNHNKKSDFVLK